MKIIAVDNYGRESVADFIVCENINEYLGDAVTKYLNGWSQSEVFFKLVPDDHKLWRGMEELV